MKNKLIYVCDNKRHLICTPYSVANLHQMAAELDIKRCWFHGGKKPHYDIPKRRVEEISKQCFNVTPEVIVTIILGLCKPDSNKIFPFEKF